MAGSPMLLCKCSALSGILSRRAPTAATSQHVPGNVRQQVCNIARRGVSLGRTKRSDIGRAPGWRTRAASVARGSAAGSRGCGAGTKAKNETCTRKRGGTSCGRGRIRQAQDLASTTTGTDQGIAGTICRHQHTWLQVLLRGNLARLDAQPLIVLTCEAQPNHPGALVGLSSPRTMDNVELPAR